MELTLSDAAGVRCVEGPPGAPLLARAQDVDRLTEACFAEAASAALLYAPNLPASFFDISSGDAGAILQKLRTYRIRLAVVCPPGSVKLSHRFGELVADERRGPYFGVFDTRQQAAEWLQLHGG